MPKTTAFSFPPGPRRTFPGGNYLAFQRDPLHFFKNLSDKHGDLAHVRLGMEDVIVVNNPDYIKEILVTNHQNFTKSRGLERAKNLLGEGLLTSEGEFHRRQRRLSQPAFHRDRIASYGAVMVQRALQMRETWHEGVPIDVAQEMMHVTLAIVAKTLFDANVDSEADEIGEALTTSLELFVRFMVMPFGELIQKLPLPANKRFAKAKERLDATIYRIIEERRKSVEDRGDLLSMLLLAQDAEGDGTGMTNEQLRDEVLTLFLAGHETTANALTWTLYLLSQNPEVETKLQAEVDAILNGRTPTVADMPQLKYAEMVLAESMRLYPPAWVIGRRNKAAYQIGDYLIPPRSIFIMSQYVTHRDPRFFDQPEVFDPQRWTPEARSLRPKFSYFPFGGGPRLCIGESFAWMEGILVLATIIQRWQLQLVAGHQVETQALITLRPKHGMKMCPKARIKK
ncbi:MAG TPA: cytochrome P450 [Acidobacteriota bacterium]|nr:cytochrome P450 [Acidobacteriota bacterium]HMZ78555.1 cytochrome P450 [Acidobacteriota bacterium]HNB70403.1 cytochrome P450 [Acidobacteriota bacterium]HNG91688.1 cytochrome P450 [Acidobacteriota bacterium]HNH81635.1 cytochrome P450 [Acidobacteriota bacterium]